MKRRRALQTLSGLSAATLSASPGLAVANSAVGPGPGEDLENPYAGVDWDRCDCLPSMSHQHQGQTDRSRDLFREMGYRHFAFSNYYPSAPTPLPVDYAAAHPDLIASPNAEQHSFLDAPLHANSLGSRLATGYGRSVPSADLRTAPLTHHFEGLQPFETTRPWRGVYRLDLRIEIPANGGGKDAAKEFAKGSDAPDAAGAMAARLSLEGAVECTLREGFPLRGPVRERSLAVGTHTLYLRAESAKLALHLDHDPAQLEVTQLRLMQGSNRPWREVFRAALDGETVEGRLEGGLVDPEGGGITLNHPTGTVERYLEMLDFDPRVLGIEVWNQLTSGFGAERDFYATGPGPSLHFYRLWDDLLRTGRRCWGFFVKDHNTYGRGRNILLVPSPEGRSREERESDALRAYRRGNFFGSVAALATNAEGEVVAPYDHSGFRFRRLGVRRDAAGRPAALEVAVAGNDPERRPQVQIRFVTDQGVVAVVDGAEAELPLERGADGRLVPIFVRVEAFAFPLTHLRGEPLTAESMRRRNVHEISRIHDHMARRGPTFYGNPKELSTPVPVVDMIFSQPLRRV